jgi:hypothetical protein
LTVVIAFYLRKGIDKKDGASVNNYKFIFFIRKCHLSNSYYLANHDIWPIISPDIPILCTQEKRVSDRPIKRLTTAAQRIGEAALQLQTEAKHEQLGLHHWLLAVLERHGAMVEGMLPGFKLEETKKELRTRLAKNETGMVLDEAAAVEQAEAFARQRNKSQAAERDLAAVVLILAGYIPAQTLSGAAASNLTNTEGAPAAPG